MEILLKWIMTMKIPSSKRRIKPFYLDKHFFFLHSDEADVSVRERSIGSFFSLFQMISSPIELLLLQEYVVIVP